jgi:hypothetical protein
MPASVTRVGNLDIQFQQNWDMTKGNQLVQSLQQTIAAVNSANVAIAALQAIDTSGTVKAPILLATTAELGPDMEVSGLSAGEVLIATGATGAAFGQLKFGELAGTDPASFAAAAEGDVIIFHDGYWTAMPDPSSGLGLGDPGQNALVMWNEVGEAFTWAIPAAGGGIKLTAGAIAVDATQLDHSKLEGLHFQVAHPTVVANDHPQYALLAAANTWALQQTFTLGLVCNSDIDVNGNIEQVGFTPEWRIQNTDDITDEGTWRIHAEPGQLIFSSVSDDGSDGENWLCATRIGEIVDAVNISSNSFTYNGYDVLVAAPQGAGNPFLPVIAGGLLYNLVTTSEPLGGGGGGSSTQYVQAALWNSSSGAVPLSLTVPQDIEIPYGSTLQAVRIQTQGPTGSCTITLSASASFPFVTGTDITGGVPPAISGGTFLDNSTLTGWTTVFALGTMLRATLTANVNFTSVKLLMRFK